MSTPLSGRLNPVGGGMPDLFTPTETGDRVLSLSDVATLLNSSQEDAKQFLAAARVPCLRLGSGGHRFLLSAVLHAFQQLAQPYEEVSKRQNQLAEAWEQWLKGRNHEKRRVAPDDWNKWLQLMTDMRLQPEDFQKMERGQRQALIRIVHSDRPSVLLDEEETACPVGALSAGNTTTQLRGRFLERKSFE